MRSKQSVISLAMVLALLALLTTACAPAAAPTPLPTKPSALPTATPVPPAPTKVPPTPVPIKPTPISPMAAEQPRYGGILLSATRVDPAHYDIHQLTTPGVHLWFVAIFNSLTQYQPITYDKLVPDLAERWEISPDGKAITFYLAKNAKFHDGTPCTSADVKVSIMRLANPPKGVASPRQGLFKALKAIETPDASTVKFILDYPEASLLPATAATFNPIVPKHILEAKGDLKRDAIGTGAFKLKKYERGAVMELAKFEDYFRKGLPYLDGVTMYIIPDLSTRVAALKTGRIKIWVGPDMTLAHEDDLKKTAPHIIVDTVPFVGGNVYILNATRAPWSDVRVRRAAFLAIDRQEAIKILALDEPLVKPMVGLPFASQPWTIPEEELLKMPGFRQPKTADLAEAKRLMAEAGYPQGFETTIRARNSKIEQDMAIFIKGQLEKLGVKAIISVHDPAAFYEKANAADFDFMTFDASMTIPDPSPIYSEYFITGAGRNYGRWSDPKFDDMFDKQARELDAQKRLTMVREMEKYLAEQAPQIWFMGRTNRNAWWPEVKGYKTPISRYMGEGKAELIWLAK